MTLSQEVVMLSVFGGVAIAAYSLLAIFDPYWLRVRTRVSQLQPRAMRRPPTNSLPRLAVRRKDRSDSTFCERYPL